MLCINSFPQEYIEACRQRIDLQLASYESLLTAAKQGKNETELASAASAFEAQFFNNLLLVLDNLFVHRSRVMEKKDGNPLNEVRMLCNSLLYNQARLTVEKSIKLDPKKSVLGLEIGAEIRLNAAQFKAISAAFLAEIETKFSEETLGQAMN